MIGTATIAGKTIERSASVTPVGVSRDEWERLPFADELALTIQHKPIFKLTCNEAYQYAHRGTIYPYAMQVERLNGFKGPITIQLCDRQVQDLDGLDVIETIVPPGVTQFNNLVYLPENMHVGIQHHSRPYAQGYATFTDKWGQTQTLLAISDHRNMIRTMPTLALLRPAQHEVIAGPGSLLPCKFTLVRTPQFMESMQVELTPTKGVSAKTANIEASPQRGSCQCSGRRFGEDCCREGPAISGHRKTPVGGDRGGARERQIENTLTKRTTISHLSVEGTSS